jgi:uncharacterized low-complexity protein
MRKACMARQLATAWLLGVCGVAVMEQVLAHSSNKVPEESGLALSQDTQAEAYQSGFLGSMRGPRLGAAEAGRALFGSRNLHAASQRNRWYTTEVENK